MEQEPTKSEQNTQQPSAEKQRPLWQIWGARLLLIFFIFLIMAYYVNIARGGI